jgi:phage repressor protein C with HTH and peptisase S24 domain
MHEQMIRLYKAAKELKGVEAPSDLADLLNESPQTINNWEKRGISKEGLLDVPDIIGCRLKWLRYGVGPMHLDALPRPGEIAVPQYETGGMGGTNGLILKDQPGVIRDWVVSPEWLRANVPLYSSLGNLCLVTGFGDSMPDLYNPGDPVLVDKGVRAFDGDGIYFFRIGNVGFIKRLQQIGTSLRVISQNKEYEPWTMPEDADFEVLAKVLKAWKSRNI